MTRSACLAAVVFLALMARAEAVEILIDSDDADHIVLRGAAKVAAPKGKPDEIKASGLVGQTTVQLGMWSKASVGECRAEFVPDLPSDGFYDVYARWYAATFAVGCEDMQPFTIVSERGELTIRQNQQIGNAWVFLGTYPFKAGKGGKVVVDAEGGFGAANVDAVKFVSAAAPPKTQPAKTLPVIDGPQDDFDKLRVRVADFLTTPTSVDVTNPKVAAKVAQEDGTAYLFWVTMDKRADALSLWSDLSLRKENTAGLVVQQTLDRLNKMAAAYVSSNAALGFHGKMQGNPQLRDDILYGLRWIYEKGHFNERTQNKAGADWFANEINSPRFMLQTMLMLWPHVPEEMVRNNLATIENMTSTPLRMYVKASITTGPNRVWACQVHILRATAEKNRERMKLSIDSIWDTLNLTVRSDQAKLAKPKYDGFYADGSFVQHDHLPYMGGYGLGLVQRVADLQEMLKGSPWELNDPKLGVLREWVYKGIEPLIYRGEEFYRTYGRSAGQKRAQNNVPAFGLMSTVAALIPTASPEDKVAYEGMLKTWLQESHYKNMYSYDNFRMSLKDMATMERVLNDPSIKPRPRPLGMRIFHNMDFVVQHRAGYAAALSMSSTRIATHEMFQGVNNRGWYQGEGALFVYNPDPKRYTDDFWPTVNPYRLPGTTIDTIARKDGDLSPGQLGKVSTNPWAGGASIDDYAVASMGLAARDVTLTAQKAWFFLDDQIVCLGSSIRSTDDRTIETVVENAKLNDDGSNALLINGEPQPGKLGWKATPAGVRFMHFAGSVPGSDMAWYFPTPVTLQLVREARTGNWKELFTKDGPTPTTRNYLTAWLDHGKSPSDAGYAYVILPGMSAEQAKAYAQKPGVEILGNTANLQAVRYPAQSVTAASVWSDAKAELGGATVEGACNIVFRETGGELRIGVSDPTQLRSIPVRISFPYGVKAEVRRDPKVKVESMNPLVLTIDPANGDGRTITASFTK